MLVILYNYLDPAKNGRD